MNKVIVVLLFAVMAFMPRVFALGDTTLTSTSSAVDNAKNTNTSVNSNFNNANSKSNSHSNSNSHSSSNASVNHSGNSSISHSGNSNVKTSTFSAQAQDQKLANTSNPSNTTNDSSGSNNKAYVYSWAAVAANEGTSNGSAGSIFGSFNIADTDNYKKAQVIIQTIVAARDAKVISDEQANAYCATLIKKMMLSVKTKRILGVGPETSGKNLFNLLGLLSVDSFYKDGDAQGGQLLNVSASEQRAATKALDQAEGKSAPDNGGNLPAGNQK